MKRLRIRAGDVIPGDRIIDPPSSYGVRTVIPREDRGTVALCQSLGPARTYGVECMITVEREAVPRREPLTVTGAKLTCGDEFTAGELAGMTLVGIDRTPHRGVVTLKGSRAPRWISFSDSTEFHITREV